MKTKYIAIDGKEFLDSSLAKAHEDKIIETLLDTTGLGKFLAIYGAKGRNRAGREHMVRELLQWATENGKCVLILDENTAPPAPDTNWAERVISNPSTLKTPRTPKGDYDPL